jgi:hypothetical protein
MAHTPQPWIFHPEERYPSPEIMEPDHWEPPMVTIGKETIPLGNSDDARLIATSPSLLTAAKAAVAAMTQATVHPADIDAAVKWLKDAIEEAEVQS